MADEALDREATRRGFINWFLGTSAGAFLLSVLYPVGRYLIPPEVGESTAGTVTLAIKPDDVKPNTGRSEERRVGKECRSRWSPYH